MSLALSLLPFNRLFAPAAGFVSPAGPATTEAPSRACGYAPPLHSAYDHLGSTSLITNAHGQRLDRLQYSPFGVPLTGNFNRTRFGYTGHQREKATGNWYSVWRYLDPRAGRWTQRDPIQLLQAVGIRVASAIPPSDDPVDRDEHPFAYVRDSPLRYTDPTGLGVRYRVVRWLVRAVGNKPILGPFISKAQALIRRRLGKDVKVVAQARDVRRSAARKLEELAHPGKTIEHTIHHPRTPHFQSARALGHTFYSILGLCTFKHILGPGLTADALDAINPVSDIVEATEDVERIIDADGP